MEQQVIPEFMQEHYQAANHAGRKHIDNLARRYSNERATFLQTIFVSKQEFLRDWNRKTGQNKKLTADEALAPMRHQYAEEAKQIAQAHTMQVEKPNEKPRDEQLSFEFKGSREGFLANIKSMQEQTNKHQIKPRR